jgi:ATP-dependent DNA helicase RecQ
VNGLKELEKRNVLMYRARSNAPLLTYLRPRTDALRLVLDPASLKDRKDRAQERCDAMIHFVQGHTCRARALLAYFSEPLEVDCGQCDVCMSQRTAPRPSIQEVAPSAVMDPLPEDLRWQLDEQ